MTYRVVVNEPANYPAMEFRYKKDAEAFKKLLSKSNNLVNLNVKADILKREVTDEGYHL